MIIPARELAQFDMPWFRKTEIVLEGKFGDSNIRFAVPVKICHNNGTRLDAAGRERRWSCKR